MSRAHIGGFAGFAEAIQRNWRTVSASGNVAYRLGRPQIKRFVTSALEPWSNTAHSSSWSSLATARANSIVKPPAKTPSRRKTARSASLSKLSLHSSAARSVCCRGSAVREPRVKQSETLV